MVPCSALRNGKQCGFLQYPDLICNACEAADVFPCEEIIDGDVLCGAPRTWKICRTCRERAEKRIPHKTKRKIACHDDQGVPETFMNAKKVETMRKEFLTSVHKSVRPKVHAMCDEMKRTKQWPSNVMALRKESDEAERNESESEMAESLKRLLHPFVHATVDKARTRLFIMSESVATLNPKVLGELMAKSKNTIVLLFKANLHARHWAQVDELYLKNELFDENGRIRGNLFFTTQDEVTRFSSKTSKTSLAHWISFSA